MKRLLLALTLSCLIGFSAVSQCTPDPLYADSLYGVWPDTITNFPGAVINVYYETQMDLVVPSNASQIPDAGLPGFPIDSGSVVSVMGLPPGMDFACNSHTPADCTFLGGDQGCAVLYGTPTELGTFTLTINLIAYLNLLGSAVEAPLSFDGYRVVVTDGTVGIEEIPNAKPSLGQNIPNPFSDRTKIAFKMNKVEKVNFRVMDLLGQEVYSKSVSTRVGENTIEFQPLNLESGIYLYSIDTSAGTITRRMVYDRP